MGDKTASIFGNPIPRGARRAAERKKAAYARKYGDDSSRRFVLSAGEVPALSGLGVRLLSVEEGPGPGFDLASDPSALVVGNIRMGFGHYRISIAMASAARARGLTPYWFDLRSFSGTVGGKIIQELDGLYSLGSRLSQRFRLFDKLYWEPLNSEGFRRLSYNAQDQKVAELLAGPCALLPRDIPYVATHAWPAQAAVHAGMTRVVNAIPDNWPMALHLAEGALHCVQTPSAWFGYRTLRGMDGDRILSPMPEGSLECVGHYIDHEIVSNLPADCAARAERVRSGKPLRILLTVGGAGAQRPFFASVARALLPLVRKGKAVLLVNAGDHERLLDELVSDVPGLGEGVRHQDDWAGVQALAREALEGEIGGIHLICDRDVFAAVYATNLLMRSSDLLVTKPSELAFYPVPKLLIRRVGGHEAWGAIRSAEVGDGCPECRTEAEAEAMLSLMLGSKTVLPSMNERILKAAGAGIYSGAYRAVDLALGLPGQASGAR